MKTALARPADLELRDVEATGLSETIRRGSRLVSRKVGVIRHFAETRAQAQDPVAFVTGVQLGDCSRFVSGGQALNAAGAGDTAAIALASAIGESVERYCGCFYDQDAMIVGSYHELDEDAVSPDVLRLFTASQTAQFGPRGPAYFDESSRIAWTWGYSLTEHRPRLVPASYVYLNYRPAAGHESWIGSLASTGLAAGGTREEAIASGLLETVERDAFTLAWMHRHAGRRIIVDAEDVQETLRRRLWADRSSVDVKLFDLTTDVAIPVVFLAMRRMAESGSIACVGASARLSPRQAVRKCVLEAGQNVPVIRNLLATAHDWQPAADFSNVTTFDYHSLTYLKRPDLVAPAFEFFDACEDRIALSHMPDRSTGRVLADVEWCVSCLRRAGYEVIAVDVTTPDLAAIGFHVVRVLVPGLVPLHYNHRRPFIGVRRLLEAPAVLGWREDGEPSEIALNPMPHPFP